MSVQITWNRGCKLSIPHLFCGAFSATFGAQTVLSELESIGRSNLGIRTNGINLANL